MKKTKKKEFNVEEARKNVEELLKRDFESILVVTNEGMVFNGAGNEFLATLSMVIDSAITKIGAPKELVERAVEVGFESAEEEAGNKEELKDEINKKMVEILDLMKEQLKK